MLIRTWIPCENPEKGNDDDSSISDDRPSFLFPGHTCYHEKLFDLFNAQLIMEKQLFTE